jgi:hypothetical protein
MLPAEKAAGSIKDTGSLKRPALTVCAGDPLDKRLVFGPAAIKLFEFSALPFKLTLIPLDLLVLICGLILTPLHLIADQGSCPQPKDRTNRGACSGMPNRGANDSTCRCAA